VLGELAVGDAEQVEGDHRVRTEAVVDAVDCDQVALGDDPGDLVADVVGE
jgi:hypothetical protein